MADGAADGTADGTRPRCSATSLTLDAVAPGARVRVTAVDGGPVRRLAELGVRRGTEVRVLTRAAGGGATVAIGTSRLALDRSVLRGIEVTPA